MALNIKSSEADALARELSRRRNKGITEVVIEALRSELDREKARARAVGMATQLEAIGRRYSALERATTLSDDAVLDYDSMLDT